MDKQNKALLLATIFIVALIFIGTFLIINFKNINRDGVACMSEPLKYAEKVLYEDYNKDYICKCSSSHSSEYIGNIYIDD